MRKTCLGKQQAFLLSYQNDQFAGENPSLKEAHTILALCNLGGFVFSSYSPANHKPKYSLCLRYGHASLSTS